MHEAIRENGITVVVEATETIADDVVSVTFAAEDGGPLPSWSPGAHVDVRLPHGGARQYSLCGHADDVSRYVVAVLHEPDGRGGSVWVHTGLRVGDTVVISEPRNHFELLPSKNYRFIAGGIGITPIIAMVRSADRAGATWSLVYGGRSISSMAFVDELASDPRVRIVPHDTEGLIDLIGLIGEPADDTRIYCCGPSSLLDAVASVSQAWPPDAVSVERFLALEQDPAWSSDSFEVELAASGNVVTVGEEDTILSVLLAAGVDVPYSCEDGVCGSCETFVLDGQPDHRDSVLSPEDHQAAGTMQICVSRATSRRLVLDL